MAKKKVFTSFDFDHDASLRILLVGQARFEDSPFDLVDYSVKEALTGDWKEKVRIRIKRVDIVAVLCGEHMHTATGVNTELKITQEENVPYFLLKGYSEKTCTRPSAAKSTDKMYDWTWPNLKLLIGGSR